MFDNVAFQVVFGLVFVYLLYSLLVTLLSELVSSWLNIRGNLLRLAIERMLNDGYYFKLAKEKTRKPKSGGQQIEKGQETDDRIDWRRGTELKERPEFRHSFAGKFYDYPAIKYLGRIEKAKKGKLTLSKPAYISADYFAESIINFLADKGEGKTILDKISFCLRFNTYHIQPNTLRQFINLLEASEHLNAYKANLMKWYSETMDRTTGWYKRKLKLVSFLLGLGIAIGFNVDTIKVAKVLAKDKEARQQLVNMGLVLAKDSARYQDFVVANGDTLHPQAVLDSGFVRVNQDINAASLVLGLGWDFADKLTDEKVPLKAGDTAFVQKLRTLTMLNIANDNITLRLKNDALTLALQQQQKDNLFHAAAMGSGQVLIEQSNPEVNQQLVDSLKRKMAADSVAAFRVNLEYSITVTKQKMDSLALKTNRQLISLLHHTINDSLGKKLAIIDSVGQTDKEGNTTVFGKRKLNFGEKLLAFFEAIALHNLVGFLVTALALSLGAPFWFDMLNKLVAIRSAGVKPEEKKDKPAPEVTIIANRLQNASSGLTPAPPDPVEDIIEAAYQQYATVISAIPGVKSVFTVTKKGIKQLQVNVNNSVTKAELDEQFPNGITIGGRNVQLSIVESGVPATHNGADGLISNRSGLNGFGSLGCVLRWKEAGTQHILSCWHVLKGDLNYAVPDMHRMIVERSSNSELAERWAGGIKGQYDYGLAECRTDIAYLDNAILRTKLNMGKKLINFRSLSKTDISNQIAIKYYNALLDKETNGIIYTDSEGVEIDYFDRTRIVQDVLLLTSENEETISGGGNSGSIVFDMQDNAIAMIIGGDKNYTYAIKLSHIFRIHSEMIIA